MRKLFIFIGLLAFMACSPSKPKIQIWEYSSRVSEPMQYMGSATAKEWKQIKSPIKARVK